jgi:hypothetical protein
MRLILPKSWFPCKLRLCELPDVLKDVVRMKMRPKRTWPLTFMRCKHTWISDKTWNINCKDCESD